MDVWGICKPARTVADWSSPLLGTYPKVRKGTRPEICPSLTPLATGSEDTGYSGHKVRNSVKDRYLSTVRVKGIYILLAKHGSSQLCAQYNQVGH